MGMFYVESFNEVASTNDRVKRAIKEQVKEGYVCRARSQTGGYGRQGRRWVSPEGGLYQSALLRPTCDAVALPTLGLVVALSIRSSLLRLASLDVDAVQVKWPNDIIANGGKIAGISMEGLAGGVCVGIGVNVFRPIGESLPPSGDKYEPAFLEDMVHGVERGAIAFGGGFALADRQEAIATVGDAVLSELGQRYPLWLRHGFEPFLEEYESCSFLQGKRVRVQLMSGEALAEGVAVGVDGNAHLLVDDGNRIRCVASGEAHIL